MHRNQGDQETMGSHLKLQKEEKRSTLNSTPRENVVKMKEEVRHSQERTKTDRIQCQQMYSNNKNNKAVTDKIWICTKK